MLRTERPDLIISDILMPNMDGYEFVTRVHADPALTDVPIIFYTATYREQEAILLAQACGVRWVLPKPSDPEVIVRTVNEALGLMPAARPAPAVPDAGGAAARPATGKLAGIEHQVSGYLDELESSSQQISQLASQREGHAAIPEDLAHHDGAPVALAVEPAGGEPAPDGPDRTGHRAGRRTRSARPDRDGLQGGAEYLRLQVRLHRRAGRGRRQAQLFFLVRRREEPRAYRQHAAHGHA